MTLIQNFAVNIRQYRRVGGLTQAQLAEALGLSVEMVGKIERGTSSPSFETHTRSSWDSITTADTPPPSPSGRASPRWG